MSAFTTSFSGRKYIFLVLYVDDILLASNDISFLRETKNFLSKNFEMKDLGDASFILGIKIHRDCSRGILRLSQESYIENVLKKVWHAKLQTRRYLCG